MVINTAVFKASIRHLQPSLIFAITFGAEHLACLNASDYHTTALGKLGREDAKALK
jgi:hypothetical protein